MVTGGVICSKALEAVNQTQQKISDLKMIDERLEHTQEEIGENSQTSRNGVF